MGSQLCLTSNRKDKISIATPQTGVGDQLKGWRNCSTHFLAAALFIFISNISLYAFDSALSSAPQNDNCESASIIEIPNSGFGTGVVLSETVDVSEATTERFEYFDPVQISAVNNKKSIWYSFYLPTSREVTVELKQQGIDISSDGAGFTTYKTDDCVVGDKEIVAAKLTPVNKFGSSYNPCLDPGRYLVQVSTRADATGPVFLKLTIGHSFNSDATNAIPYDFPDQAYDFGRIADEKKIVEYDFGCHSIDNSDENKNLPVANPEFYTQSTWHVFQTDDHFDVFSIIVEPAGNMSSLPPDSLVFILFEGNVLKKSVASLSKVQESTVMAEMGNKRVIEYLCGATLKPNTSYTFQLLFPADYYGDRLRVRIAQWGNGLTGAPIPLKDRVKKTSVLGVLPSSLEGETTHFRDYFSCNAFVSDNNCGSVQSGDLVTYNKYSFDMAVWVFFELEDISDVKIRFEETIRAKFVRLFSVGLPDQCGAIVPNGKGDLVTLFTKNFNRNCMPAGKYSMQILGNSAPEDANTPYGDDGVLGREIDLTIEVQFAQTANKFSLNTAGAVDSINNLEPLPDGVMVSSQSDTFSCVSTVLPDGIDCGKITKASYRIFQIGDGNRDGVADSGYLHITKLNVKRFNYAIFQNDLSVLASAQNTHRSDGQIMEPNNYLDGCITNSSSDLNFYCITPGKYTLATLADQDKTGYVDHPQFKFKILKTKYAKRSNAEDLGDVTNIRSTITSDRDTFSCLSNPATIGGLAPAGSKLIYRQFYLSESKLVSISSPTGHKLNLFMGQAKNAKDALEPWKGKNMKYEQWSSGFTSQTTHPCYPLIPGWYTVVSYGSGPDYQNPSMDGTDGARGDAGSRNTIAISLDELYDEACDSPSKACLVNNGQPITWDLTARSNNYPNTSETFYFDTSYFGCAPDTPWINHPIVPCDPADLWVLYYVFKLGEPSYVSIQNIPSLLSTKIYPFDVRKDSALMITSDPVYPCSGVDVEERQICNLQAGTYTLVIFSGPGDPYFVAPIFYVERVGQSRFDHARNAYDFGSIPADNNPYWGKAGDIHPFNSELAPSNDFIYCSTGAQSSDPTDGICGAAYNASTYNSSINNVLLNEYSPAADGSQVYTLRNLWYTFVLKGTGKATLEIDHHPDTSSLYRPLISLYQSDADGTIPFDQLIISGGVDSTTQDGLSFIKCNSDSLCSGFRSKTIHFEKSECSEDEIRYYLLVSMWGTAAPNQQVSLSIQYDGMPIMGVRYDHYSTANEITGQSQSNPSAAHFPLGEGIFTGAPARLECATRDSGDPFISDCYSRSIWYKFTTHSSGFIRLAHEMDGDTESRSSSAAMKLYREIRTGDPTSLVEVKMATLDLTDPESGETHVWQQGTGIAGTYYIFWTDCSSDFDIYKPYSPVVWISENPGDFCHDAVEISIKGAGVSSGSLIIDSHTMGTDFGEDGSYMGCLFGPEGFKSSWFILKIDSETKLDVTFDLQENTTANPDRVLYRILYGDCSAMTAGPCNNNANTTFSLSCMESGGNYFIQVVSPDTAKGEIHLTIRTEETLNQDCVPVNPLKPVANFDTEYDCFSPAVTFLNRSTQGENVSYTWTFPDGQTSSELSPTYTFPQADSTLIFNVSLLVVNTHFGTSDSITKLVAVPPASVFPQKDTLVCAGDPLLLNVYVPRGKYLWQDGSTNPTYDVTLPGLYWVEITAFDCTIRDSILVDFYLCNKQIIDTTFCAGSYFNERIIQSDTVIEIEVWDSPTSGQMMVYNIHVMDSFLIHQSITICEGERFTVGNSAYTSSGVYTDIFQTKNGCDSTIITKLVVRSAPSPEIIGATYFCKGGSSVLEVKGHFQTYTWSDRDQTGSSIEVFSEGVYHVTVADSNGCKGTASITVHPPVELMPSIEIHAKDNGQHISCEGAADGEVTLSVSGGQSPYRYVWSNGITTKSATNLHPGIYTGTITDQTGCSASFDFVLEDAPPISLDVSVMQTVCYGEENGSIQVDVLGVTGPCEFSVDDSPFQNENIFYQLDAGFHKVLVLDISGCEAETTIVLEETQPINVEVYPAQAELSLGKSIDLQVLVNSGNIREISWTPTTDINCESCQSITVKPMETTTYVARVMDENNCTETAYSEIKVMKDRQVFIPNSFTPNNDGLNDRLAIFSGNNIETIRQFKIFDRWGSLVFDIQNIPPNEESIGWDGTVDGYQLPSAVYVYFAEIEFIDNHRELVKGDVTLIR